MGFASKARVSVFLSVIAVTGLIGSERVSALFVADNSSVIDARDLALVQAFRLNAENPTAANLLNDANPFLPGSQVIQSDASISPLPSLQNADFAQPSGVINARELALMQAVRLNGGPDADINAILADANSFLPGSQQFQGEQDVISLPGQAPVQAIALSSSVDAGLAGDIRVEVAVNDDLPAPGSGFTLASAEPGSPPASFVRIATVEGEAVFAAALERSLAESLDLSGEVAEADKPSAFKQIAAFDSVAIPGLGISSVEVVNNATGEVLATAN